MSAEAWGVDHMPSNATSPEVDVNAIADLLAASAPPPVVQSVTTTAPPADPAEFALYGVPSGATGAWSGEDGKLARWWLAGWRFFAPATPFRAFILDEGREATLTSAGWLRGGAVSPFGAAVGYGVRELEVATASGAAVSASGLILDRDCIVGVAFTSMGVTGPASIDVGISGEADIFGDAVGVSLGDTNLGMLYAPRGFYADTDVVLTANGENFAGGSVRLAAFFLRMVAPGTS